MKEWAQAEIQKINKKVADKEQEMLAASAAHVDAGLQAEEARIAHEVASDKSDSKVKALQAASEAVNEANSLASAKAAGAKIAGRDAEAAQLALDDAVTELDAAKEVVKHKKGMKKNLWALYDRIEEFYDASSDVTKVMRNSEDECSKKPNECLISDGPGGGKAKLT